MAKTVVTTLTGVATSDKYEVTFTKSDGKWASPNVTLYRKRGEWTSAGTFDLYFKDDKEMKKFVDDINKAYQNLLKEQGVKVTKKKGWFS